jgi:integrase
LGFVTIVRLRGKGHKPKANAAKLAGAEATRGRGSARLGELLGSDWDDDLGDDVWNVSKQWTKQGELVHYTKTKAGVRRIPLSPEFVRYMKAYRLRSQFSQSGQPIFAALGRGGSKKGGGTRISHRNVQRRAWEPIRKGLGLPEKVTFHQLRHAFASRAHARGVTLQDPEHGDGPFVACGHGEGPHPLVRT